MLSKANINPQKSRATAFANLLVRFNHEVGVDVLVERMNKTIKEINEITADWNGFLPEEIVTLYKSEYPHSVFDLFQCGNNLFFQGKQPRLAKICYTIGMIVKGRPAIPRFQYCSTKPDKPSIINLSEIKNTQALSDKFKDAIKYLCTNPEDIAFYMEFNEQLEKIRRDKIVDALGLLPRDILYPLLRDLVVRKNNVNPFRFRLSLQTNFMSFLGNSTHIDDRLEYMHGLLECTNARDDHELTSSDLERIAEFYENHSEIFLYYKYISRSEALRAIEDTLSKQCEIKNSVRSTEALLKLISHLQNLIEGYKDHPVAVSHDTQIHWYFLLECRDKLIYQYETLHMKQDIVDVEYAIYIFDIHRCYQLSPRTDKFSFSDVLLSRERLKSIMSFQWMSLYSSKKIYDKILKLEKTKQLELLRDCLEDPTCIWADKLRPLTATIREHVESLKAGSAHALSVAPAATLFESKRGRIPTTPIPVEVAKDHARLRMSFDSDL